MLKIDEKNALLDEMKSHKNSITANALFNVLKTTVSVLAPLITYSYIARVLGASNLGRVNFSISMISYYQLIASLGITNYAISEGAKIRQDNNRLSKFSSEILAINCISTAIAYALFGFSIILIPSLKNYSVLLVINSISMAFTLLGMDWLYGAIEQYRFISIRSIIFQIISVALVLLLIKNEEQSWLYMIIYTFPFVGTGIVNFLYRRRFVSISFKGLETKNIKKHLKPILMIWGMSIASVIYINSDTIMLVAIKGDQIAGLYSTGVKASHVCCLIMAAISTVLMPRISIYVAEKKKKEFSELFSKTVSALLFLIIPMCVGLFTMSKETVLLLGGAEYIDAEIAARIISFNVILSPLNGLVASQVFIPFGKQKASLIATIAGALINIILNFILIPVLSLNGAALTTIIAEATVMFICLKKSQGIISLKESIRSIWHFIIGALPVPFIYFVIFKITHFGLLFGCVVCVAISVAAYILILKLLHDKTLEYYIAIAARMIGRIKK